MQVERLYIVTLDRDTGLPKSITMHPVAADAAPTPGHAPQPGLPVAFDDDLANATWEDAEWQ